MENVLENKEKQGFQEKCPCCANCVNFNLEIRQAMKYGYVYKKEVNLRCDLGGFGIKKQNWCKEHQYKI